MATTITPRTIRALERALPPSSAFTLPAFLAPAFQCVLARQFSATANRPSKLGRMPLSIPPGVELTLGEPKVKKDATTYRQVEKRTLSVAGPLGSCGRFWSCVSEATPRALAKNSHPGKLDLEIQPFVKIDLDPAARKVSVSVQDREIKQQREMWGKREQQGRRARWRMRLLTRCQEQLGPT